MAIHITTPTELQNMNLDLTADYILDNDLDMAGFSWTPIGLNPSDGFSGTFDGQGFTISNLTCDDTIPGNGNTALFGRIKNGSSSIIHDFNLKNVTVTGVDCQTVLGYILGGGQFYNIHVSNVTINSISGGSESGGFVGEIDGNVTYPCTITDCDVTNITINCAGGGEEYFSGFAGAIYHDVSSSEVLISKCFAIGINIIGVANSNFGDVGGLVGYNEGDISNCFVKGNISNVNYDGGGLCGYAYNCTILNCYSEVNVSGDMHTNSNFPQAGGLIGYADAGISNITTIQNCYSVGTVTGLQTVGVAYSGGFIGFLQDSTYVVINNCAWYTGSNANAIGGNHSNSNNPVALLATPNSWGTDESNHTKFYSKTHAVYAQSGSNPWSFYN